MPLPAQQSPDIIRPVITSTADVIALVDSGRLDHRRGLSARLVVLIALGGVFVDAYDFSSLSVGAVQLQQQFHLSAWQLGTVSASMAVSALIGALFGGVLVDRIGRLPTFLLDLWFFVIAAIGAAVAPNLTVLVAFRLLMGFGVGLDFPVALSFVSEFTSLRRKGRAVNLSYVNWYTAAVVGYLVTLTGLQLGATGNLWRFAVGFGALPAAVILVLRYRYMFESPMWAAHQGDLEGAARTLERCYGIQVEVRRPRTPPPRRSSAAVSFRTAYRTLFSATYRRRSVLAAVMGAMQSLEYYAVIFYLPVISQLIFGHSLRKAILGGILFNAIGIAGSLAQALLSDRLGIRPLAVHGTTVAMLALIGIAFSHSTGSMAATALAVALFMIGHTVGPGPQCMAYGTLSYPTTVRGTAVGWTQGMLRVGSICGFYVFPLLLAAVGFETTFLLLALAPLAILVALRLIRWEPIGADVEAEAIRLDTGGHAR